MIVARVFAGIGNQLFQYAAARELGLRLGAEVRFDGATWYAGRDHRRSTRRDYLLRRLGLEFVEASPADRAAPFCRTWWLQRRLRPGWTHLQQHGGEVPLAAFAGATGEVLLEGYWQSEAFFPNFKPHLARELLALPPDPAANARWLDAVRAPGAVALHVRRGDYVAHARHTPSYRVLGTDYYTAALARLRGRTDVRRAVVFSDDPAWCDAELKLGLPTDVVRRADPHAHVVDDLLTMAQATNLIVANSTFSWWAAWIATQRGPARVVMPARWFDDPDFATWTQHLRVPGWETIP
jgi:hypothetical protein